MNLNEYNIEYLVQYINSIGKQSEAIEFCKKIQEAEYKEKQSVSISLRMFAFNGNYSGCCYELSGEDFNHDETFEYFLEERGHFSFELDPSYETVTDEDKENYVQMKNCKYFEQMYEKLQEFVDGDLGEGEGCYNIDNWGFDALDEPDPEDLKKWFGNLYISKDDFDFYESIPEDELEEYLGENEIFEISSF